MILFISGFILLVLDVFVFAPSLIENNAHDYVTNVIIFFIFALPGGVLIYFGKKKINKNKKKQVESPKQKNIFEDMMSCVSCNHQFSHEPKKTFLGFQKRVCPVCGLSKIYPLTKNHRTIYQLLFIIGLSLLIERIRQYNLPYLLDHFSLLDLLAIVLATAVIISLYRDYSIRKVSEDTNPERTGMQNAIDTAELHRLNGNLSAAIGIWRQIFKDSPNSEQGIYAKEQLTTLQFASTGNCVTPKMNDKTKKIE